MPHNPGGHSTRRPVSARDWRRIVVLTGGGGRWARTAYSHVANGMGVYLAVAVAGIYDPSDAQQATHNRPDTRRCVATRPSGVQCTSPAPDGHDFCGPCCRRIQARIEEP